MRKRFPALSIVCFLLLSLCGCSAIGEKSGSLSVIYTLAALISVILLIAYLLIPAKKSAWFILLFTSVLVVNLGYLALALSRNLNEALHANRLAYFGSVFLPLAMWMIIANVTHLRNPKWLRATLLGISILIFLIAASPGYLDIYYQEVTFLKQDGVSVLQKVYGPLHPVYLVYLLGYFCAMVGAIVYATWQDKIDSLAYACILALAVFANIIVWLIEQMVRIEFEVLSISYILSESFLLGLHLFMAEAERKKASAPVPASPAPEPPAEDSAEVRFFLQALPTLTPKERSLYDCYVSGMSTAQILEALSIKENTLKFHNKNLYGKLGVSSRKQLLQIARKLP